jgi:hypothetical protein
MKKDLTESRIFTRFLEIMPGLVALSALFMPFILAPILPVAVAYFILAFNFYWFVKAINIMRHMINGFRHMWHDMKVDFLERAKQATADPVKLEIDLRERYEKSDKRLDYLDWLEFSHLGGNYSIIKNWEEIYHVVFVTNYQEDYFITESTFEAIRDSNYPNEKIIVVSCGEKRDEESYLAVKADIEKNFKDTFLEMFFFMHDVLPDEVIGKGGNIHSAMTKFYDIFKVEYPEIRPENVICTTLDADHIVHSEYFSSITYKNIIDADRDRKTYQPNILMFNNIWDAPSPSRVLAVASSFWQMVESMRPYRLRTFASHSQSLATLLITDFVSTQTIVEDGHQYWRTYFAFNGNHEMMPIYVPIYHDTVLGNNFWETLKNQYKQRRRWAWGISDFPFIVKNYMKHPEIPFGEKFIQTYRHVAGHIAWSTSSFLLAFAWLPLLFNSAFQDTVLAHNVSIYSSMMLKLAWIAVFANAWLYFLLLPPLPKRFQKTKVFRYAGMVFQWAIAPFVPIILSSLPALESQIRLMLGQSLNVFWTTPKVRGRDK